MEAAALVALHSQAMGSGEQAHDSAQGGNSH